jgi:hypothetical protein
MGQSNYGASGYINSFTQTSDREYALGGRTYTSNATDGIAALIKTDSKGIIQWNSTYGPDGSSVASLIQASDGGYAFGGTVPGQENYPQNYIWLVKTDSSGNLRWSQTNNDTSVGFYQHDNVTYSVGGSFSVNWLIETNDGGFMIAGSWNPYSTFLDNAFYLVKTAPSLPPPSPTPTVPEFQSLTIPLLFFIIVVAGLLVYFKKHKTNHKSQTY